ncbi:MAG: hypothetical protein Q7S58_14695 [Candidatus Binatus sp.]|uniref:hypothetical protein n=1 Tax=Candidatus Binatus sp. TaxID=2811406 RepID=UPI00271EBC1D|nr:hypothetical protein [Candidatus Binatus sp.]MDO8433651.1 hypothetical protein [Candidatus Binatus sp.]
MASLIVQIMLAGVLGAAGALVGGLTLLALRLLLTPRIRAQQAQIIREIGIIAAAKRALLEVPEPEDFSRKAPEQAPGLSG